MRSRARLEAWQARRLAQALDRARAHFPFYRDLPSSDLEAFPILDKQRYLDAFQALNLPGLELESCRRFARESERTRDFSRTLGELEIGLSSGTSGTQGVFLTSPWERAHWAGVMLAKALPEGLLHSARIALFLRASGPLYASLSAGPIRFAYFDLRRPLDELLADLRQLDPTVLVAPPQMLRLLAAALAARQLTLRLRRLYSVAEVLDPHDEAEIQTAFESPVHQIYQAAEGFLGISCGSGRLHLNEDLLLIEKEWLDRDSGRFTPIVTDLFRRTQAVVRYRLGDVLVASAQACPCGSPMLAVDRIEGRCDDLLALPAAPGATLKPLFADYVTRTVLGASPAVLDFRCVQTAPNVLELDLKAAPDFDFDQALELAREALAQLCRQQGLRIPSIVSKRLFDTDPAVKVRRVRRSFPVSMSELLPSAGR
jgi:putative adenylate-forming enzyme